ncbi:MAG TPA: hypothetical protein VM779_02215, partial [Thermoanaerobaculia bacterium]|nr:hypothetical protein [Thermoanaerobaculia bacterium]
PLIASRTSEMRIDANSRDDLHAQLRQRDLVIDAAGPFQKRTPALIEAASKLGFDVIDISDCAEYAAMVYEHEAPIAAAGIRVLTACSSLSTVSAAVLGMSSLKQPRRLTVYLRPASRHTANPGAVQSFLSAITYRMRTVQFGQPLGRRRGVVVRSADAITLPRVFPSLRDMELVVDAGIPGVNAMLARPGLRQYATRYESKLMAVARAIGPKRGVLAFEIAEGGGKSKHQYFTGDNTHLTAIIPAVLAAQSIAAGKFPHRGVVPPTQHAGTDALLEAMHREGIAVTPPWGT